jgi:hypothetical protein
MANFGQNMTIGDARNLITEISSGIINLEETLTRMNFENSVLAGAMLGISNHLVPDNNGIVRQHFLCVYELLSRTEKNIPVVSENTILELSHEGTPLQELALMQKERALALIERKYLDFVLPKPAGYLLGQTIYLPAAKEDLQLYWQCLPVCGYMSNTMFKALKNQAESDGLKKLFS